ncbi:MAG: gliding motility-associated ABC transporter substrate-binding protein GldG [Bacteroidia bacterium]|jgi:ABC-2 type transport system permease protein
MKQSVKKSFSRKKAAVISLALMTMLVILLNMLGSFRFYRLDLTTEKRYSLNRESIKLLTNLKDVVYVKVYLEGELPAGYKKLRNATQEMLDEFRAFTPNVEYEFINPSASEDERERKAIYRQLMQDGLVYTTPVEEKGAGVSQTLLWPGALVSFRGQTLPLQLLKSSTYANEELMLTRAVNDLEYELTNTIRKLNSVVKPRVAFIEGHGELDSLETKDLNLALKEYYTVARVRLDSSLSSLIYRTKKDDSLIFVPRYSAIIIAKPDSVFSEKDKFLIDQYVMRGGKVLWLIDRVDASMDSLSASNATMVYPLDLNLDDMLFRYGARINSDLVMDLNASVIPVIVGMVGNQPRFAPKRWPYFPLCMPASNHPTVNNLNATRFEFANSIDTVGSSDIRKSVLLRTSGRSTRINAPARISLNILREKPDPKIYAQQGIPLAVLLEGKFQSVYQNRLIAALMNNPEIGYKPASEKPGKMIVVADGDVARNAVNKNGQIAPLGYDRYSGELFGNKDFLLNCVNYLCDDAGLISVRSRTAKLRLLDETKIKAERTSIQLKNVVLPIVLLLLAGLVLVNLRKRKYARSLKGPV